MVACSDCEGYEEILIDKCRGRHCDTVRSGETAADCVLLDWDKSICDELDCNNITRWLYLAILCILLTSDLRFCGTRTDTRADEYRSYNEVFGQTGEQTAAYKVSLHGDSLVLHATLTTDSKSAYMESEEEFEDNLSVQLYIVRTLFPSSEDQNSENFTSVCFQRRMSIK